MTAKEVVYRVAVAPFLDTFVSYRFEDIVRSYFHRLVLSGARRDILRIGSYWYDDKAAKRSGEFDVALETLRGYEIYEVKFLSSPMKEDLIMEEAEKIRRIAGLQISSFGFISSSGFEEPGPMRISGEDLFAF